MSEIPPWIDERIERNLENSLTQKHVVETMLESDRPFFSLRQLHARIKPDVGSGVTVGLDCGVTTRSHPPNPNETMPHTRRATNHRLPRGRNVAAVLSWLFTILNYNIDALTDCPTRSSCAFPP